MASNCNLEHNLSLADRFSSTVFSAFHDTVSPDIFLLAFRIEDKHSLGGLGHVNIVTRIEFQDLRPVVESWHAISSNPQWQYNKLATELVLIGH